MEDRTTRCFMSPRKTLLRAALFSILAGCSDGSEIPISPRTEPTAARVAEGTRIAGTVITEISHQLPGLSPESRRLPTESFTAMYRRGIATPEFDLGPSTLGAPSVGRADIKNLFIAVADSPRDIRENKVTFLDGDGRKHDIVMARDGMRLLRSRHLIDGELFAVVENRWRKGEGMWILQGAQASATWKGSHASLQARVDLSSFAAPSAFESRKLYLNDTAVATLALLGPEAAYASCPGAALMLAGSSGALAVAMVGGGWALIGASMFTYFGALLDYLETCYE